MRWRSDFHIYAGGEWFIRLPLWIPFAICAGAVGAMFIAPRLRRRVGACPHCGYSLAGLPDPEQARCPECGKQRRQRAD